MDMLRYLTVVPVKRKNIAPLLCGMVRKYIYIYIYGVYLKPGMNTMY